MTSWSDRQLEQLCDPDNHKISYDGYNFRWLHKLEGRWSVHSVKYFEEFTEPYSWLQYWLAVWSRELTYRRLKRNQRKRSIQRKINRVVREMEHATADKVKQIHRLNPELTQKEISDLLDISQQMVARYLK